MTGLAVALSLCVVSMATAAMEGVSNGDDWAYQWYTGEPFRFKCQTSGLNITADNYVVWDTPTRKTLPINHDQTDYQLSTVDGVRDVELLVKNVRSEFHGVYTCHVYADNTAKNVGKVIYGLNIHDVKYHDMIDKYRHNIVVAVIATVVFIVPFATICLVKQFQYEERTKRKHGTTNGKPYMVEHELKQPYYDGVAENVKSTEGEGAYENPDPDLSTQL